MEIEHHTGKGVGAERFPNTTSIRVEFTSDESVIGSGFELRFKQVSAEANVAGKIKLSFCFISHFASISDWYSEDAFDFLHIYSPCPCRVRAVSAVSTV